MIVIGIDGGLTGAIAFLSVGRAVVFDLPTRELAGSITKRIDAVALRALVRAHVPAGEPVHVCIEALATGGDTRGGNAMSIGSQYRTRGAIETTLELLGLDCNEVHPAKWKTFYGLAKSRKAVDGPGKKDSLIVARELYPQLGDRLKRVLDHNRAEAVLVAHWALKVQA